MKKKELSWFYKMLLFFLATVLTTSCILTFFSYGQFSDSLREKAYADYQSNLRKNAQTWNDLVSEVTQLQMAISVDPQSETFFSMEEYDPIKDYNTYLKVKRLFNINPYVEAFCLYNPAADYALFCGTDAIPLEPLWARLQDKNGKLITAASRTDTQEGLLLFGFPVYINSFESPQGAIFLALNAERTTNHILGNTDYPQLMLDEKGEILLASGADAEADTVSAWALQSNGSQDNETLSLQGGLYLCSLHEEETCRMVSYASYDEVMRPLRKKRNLFLLVCVAVMTVSACLQFFIVKRLYRPIALLREDFSRSRFANGTAASEFELIRQVYENAAREVKELEEKSAANLPLVKADLLRELVTEGLSPSQVQSRLQEHDISIPFSGMFIASVLIDPLEEGNGFLQEVIQTEAARILTGELEELFWIECILRSRNEVIAFINNRAGQMSAFDDLTDGLRRCRDALLASYPLTLTIGLDGITQGIEDCSQIYQRVRQLMKNRFALGDNQVIFPARAYDLLPEPLNEPDKLMQEVLSAFDQGSRDAFIRKTDDFLNTICRYEYTSASLLFARLYLEMAAHTRQFSGVREHIPAIEMNTEPTSQKEARRLLLKAFDTLQTCRQAAEQLKGNKHYRKIMEGQNYILEHFSDASLSVDRIAEQMGYSPNYFARLFRSITGYYVNDYIRQVRIMKAQELLQNTSQTISEIAEATGFTSSNYFYSIFKKETGMTPAAYRKGTE